MSARDFADLTHPDHSTLLRWWHYTDTFAVANFIGKDGGIVIKPAIRNGEHCYWHEPLPPLPLYRAAELRSRPDAPVLVLESERAAETAATLFPDHVCVTWPGGSNAVNKADLQPLRGRDVVLWPDNDGRGATAMARLRERLQFHGSARTVAIVDVPRTWPAGWDVAKTPPTNVTVDTLRALLRQTGAGIRRARVVEHEEDTVAMKPELAADDRTARLPPRSSHEPALRAGAGQEARGPKDEDPAVETPTDESVPLVDSDWPTPDLTLLDSRRGDLPAFPIRVLPLFWRRWIACAAHHADAPVDHVALSLLTVAASLIGTARRVAPTPSSSEPCILWTALVGASGALPGMDPALRLVRALDRDLDAANAEAHRRHVSARERARAEAWWWREAVRGAAANQRAASDIPATAQEPPPFASRRLVVENPDAVAEALLGSPRGTLLVRGALDGWLQHAAYGEDKDRWLGAWSANRWTVSRKGRPPGISGRFLSLAPDAHRTIDIAHAAVSILGGVCPDAIAAAFADGSDALAAHILFAWPQRATFHRLSDAAAPANGEARDALARLRDMPEERDMPLTPDALSAFDDFRDHHHADADSVDEWAADWWTTGGTTVLRLAGVLTLLDWATRPEGTAEPAHVHIWAIEAAASLWQDYLWPHAHAVLRLGGGGHHERLASRMLLWIKRQEKAEVSRTELRCRALGRTCDGAKTERVAQVLVSTGWLRSIDTAGLGPGRPPSRWVVNPALFTAGNS